MTALSNETEARLRAEVERNTAPFRTTDIAGLCERLDCAHERQNNARDRETITLSKTTLERQAAEIERLRATLGYYSYADDGGKRAIAALKEKTHD